MGALATAPQGPNPADLESSGDAVLSLRPLAESDLGRAVTLIGRAMNGDEAGFAAQALHHHFSCRRAGIDDGRACFALVERGGIIGLAGLHHYSWGPPENVWLSWFAVEPDRRGGGLGALLLRRMEDEARGRGHQQLFVETYSTPEFARARAFYATQGFREVASIPAWLPDGGAMVVYYKPLYPPV